VEEPPRGDPRRGALTALPVEARALLRQHALACAIASVRGRPRPLPPASPGEPLRVRRGAFVSVYVGDELRGCLGSVEPRGELLPEVGRLAGEAATEDTRFARIEPDELRRLDVEISVLGPCAAVADARAVDAGRQGVVVRHGARVGVLLPQVGARHGWDGATLVREAARKAGIEPHEEAGLSIEVFEADVF